MNPVPTNPPEYTANMEALQTDLYNILDSENPTQTQLQKVEDDMSLLMHDPKVPADTKKYLQATMQSLQNWMDTPPIQRLPDLVIDNFDTAWSDAFPKPPLPPIH